MIKQRTYQELHHDFLQIQDRYRAVPFVRLDGDFSDEDRMTEILFDLKRTGWGGMAPIPVSDLRKTDAPTFPVPGTDAYWDSYAALLERARKLDMRIVYYDDIDNPSGRLCGAVIEKYPDTVSHVLCLRVYECTEGELTRRTMDTDGITMSLVAFEQDTAKIVDLRDEIVGDQLIWDTPDGNWNILQFICRPNPDSRSVNLLSHEASMRFVEMSYQAFADRFASYIGDVVEMTFYDDIQFQAQNRRMWSPDFNAFFEKEYGFDPSLLYPALYYDIGEKTEYATAYLMRCRARMLSEGFFRAVSEFTAERGLMCGGSVSETKTAACSNLTGDVLQNHQYADMPAVDMTHSYMYGFNGIKLAASAAYNYGKEYVCAAAYNRYSKLDQTILYKEAMNCFVRGVNVFMPNVMQWSGKSTHNHDISMRNPILRDIYPRYTDFLARCQTMLQGGTHVCDIAMLYPIDSLHGSVYFYEQKERAFEFPPVLQFADYINNINAVLNYCGRDLTVLHPNVLEQNGRCKDGVLYVSTPSGEHRYHILILPAMSIVSIRTLRLIKDFFECGGKVLATSSVPFKILEDDAALRKEAAEIVEYLFDAKENVLNYRSDYQLKTNERGGIAVFLRSSMTDLDGTEYVEASRINQTLWMFDTPVDIVFEHLPRIPNSGILSLNLIAFQNCGATAGIASGGVFNYIHKHHDNCEVYYVSNTTVKDYSGHILISGYHEVEEWNPHTGKIKQFNEQLTTISGNPYTTFSASIPHDTSVFYVCRPRAKKAEEIRRYDDFTELRRYYAEKAGKKLTNKRPHLFGR